MFNWLEIDEVKKNKDLLRKYIADNYLSRRQYSQYIQYYGTSTLKKLVEGGIIDAFV